MKRKVWIFVAAAIVLIVGGFFLWRQAQARSASTETRTAVVERGTLRITVAGSGRIEPASAVNLSFTLPGRVAGVAVEIGDAVEAGQPLAWLETADLERAVTQAELTVRQAELRLERLQEPPDEADLQAAEAAVSDALAAYQAAQRNLQLTEHSVSVGDAVRAAQLARDETYRTYQNLQSNFDAGEAFVTESMVQAAHNAYLDALGAYNRAVESADLQMLTARNEVTRAYNAYQQAQNNLQRLREGAGEIDLEAARLDLEAAQLALDRARADLDKATLRAPFAGLVSAVNVAPGEQAPTGLPAVSLIDPSHFRLTISVDEIDVAKLSEGLTAEVSIDALPDWTLNGVVERISPAATFDQGAPTYAVIISLDPSDAPLRAGMSATATILVEEVADQLLIPNWIVRVDQVTGQTYVYRQAGREVERVDVQLGIRYEGYSQVLSGLEEGQVLVLVRDNGFFSQQSR